MTIIFIVEKTNEVICESCVNANYVNCVGEECASEEPITCVFCMEIIED